MYRKSYSKNKCPAHVRPNIEFCKKFKGVRNLIHFYTKYESPNDLIMLVRCTKLGNYLHPGKLQGFAFNPMPINMDFSHGQILIETETDSLVRGTRFHRTGFDGGI